MNKKIVRLVSSFVAGLFSASAVNAAVLDQSYTPFVTVVAQARNIDWSGQSFTAGTSGQLTSFGALIFKENGVTADMQFDLFPIIDGLPDFKKGVALTVPNSQIPQGFGTVGNYSVDQMMKIDLSGYSFQVIAGQQYGALVHSSIGFNERPMINWLGGCNNNNSGTQCGFNNGVTSDGYLQGSPLQVMSTDFSYKVYPRSDFDFAFSTYVAPVPEPETYVMLAVGLGIVSAAVNRRRRKQA